MEPSRRRSSFRWALQTAALLWAPFLVFDLVSPHAPELVPYSSVLVRALLVTIAIYVGVVLVISASAALLSARLESRSHETPGARAESAPAAIPITILASGFLPLGREGASAFFGRALGMPSEGLLGLLLLAASLLAGGTIAIAFRAARSSPPRTILRVTALGAIAFWCVSAESVAPAPLGGRWIASLAASALAALLWCWEAPRPRRSTTFLVLGLALVGPGLAGQAALSRQLRDEATAHTPHLEAGANANVVLVMIDTVRADHTTLSGYPVDTTPRLAQAASGRATLFRSASAPSSATLPSVGAMFTSRLPASFRGMLAPPKGSWTLPQAFRSAGFQTAGFTANGLLNRGTLKAGFDDFWEEGASDFLRRSFLFTHLLTGRDDWEGFRIRRALRLQKARAGEVFAHALSWIDAHRGRPFFVYVHLIDPHWPYYRRDVGILDESLMGIDTPLVSEELLRLRRGAPENAKLRDTEKLRELVGRYDEEIFSVDREIGRLLDEVERMGLRDSTLILFLADHGEEFFDHNGYAHGHDVFEELIHVPLLFLWPEAPPFAGMPKRVDVPVSLLDILPTLTDYLELPEGPKPTLGHSLRPLLEQPETERWWPVPAQAIASGETLAPGEIVASYREGGLKVRLRYDDEVSPSSTPDVTVFDLATDPTEQTRVNLDDPRVERAVQNARNLFQVDWEHAYGETAEKSAPWQGNEAEARLRALGYID